MSGGNVFLWVIVPYVCMATFVLGHIWRYRYDKFGWTTRSSQIYERRLLRLGSPLFHFGILLVIVGHVVGILIPETVTKALGVSESAYHFSAVTLGTVSGVMTVSGMAILIYRRRTTGPVFSATTVNDKVMYVLLALTIALGLATTLLGNVAGPAHDYRLDVAPWFRSIFYFHPDTDLIVAAPIGFELHVISACLLFAFWPFSRLVHVFSAPIGYLTRPYIVYRSRDTAAPGPARGWERPSSPAGSRRLVRQQVEDDLIGPRQVVHPDHFHGVGSNRPRPKRRGPAQQRTSCGSPAQSPDGLAPNSRDRGRPQPPIIDIDRPGRRNPGSLMP